MKKRILALLLAAAMTAQFTVQLAATNLQPDGTPPTPAENEVPTEEAPPVEEEPAEEQEERTVTYEIPAIGRVEDIVSAAYLPNYHGLVENNSWTGKFYDQLDANSQAIYNVLKKAYWNGLNDAEHAVTLPTPVDYKIITVGEDEEWEYSTEDLGVDDAFAALKYDEPSMSCLNFTVKNNENKDILPFDIQLQANATQITGVVFVAMVEQPAELEQSKLTGAVNTAKAAIGSKKSDYETLKAIHDHLSEHITYDLNASYNQTAHSGLVKGSTVCAGYAKSFKVLCDEYGIPCVLIGGTGTNKDGVKEGHMWNYVQMEDGKWYAVDVTWDDQKSGIRNEYFLCGRDSMGFNNKTFAEAHEESGLVSPGMTRPFVYPQLSSTAYTPAPEHEHNGALVEEVPATCTTAGSKAYYTCDCGKFFEDEACTKEIADPDQWKVIPALGHSYGAWTAAEDGHSRSCSVCKENETAPHSGGTATCVAKAVCIDCGAEYGEVDPNKHVHTSITDGKPATCTEAGREGNKVCDDCNKTISSGKDIPALGHDFSEEWSSDADNHWHTCSRCGEKDSEVAHIYDQQVVNDSYKAAAATCRTPATYYKSCVCGAKGTETFESGEKTPTTTLTPKES